jgi:hypothetical protein
MASVALKKGAKPMVPTTCNALKMTRAPELVRDFIHDSLYNPTYGYFSKSDLHILSTAPAEPIQFNELKDALSYDRIVSQLYKKVLPENIGPNQIHFDSVWHTPCEIFRPIYGQGIARYVLERFAERYPEEFVIYEIGPGNGSLCKDVLDQLQKENKPFYERMKYFLVEISPHLSTKLKDIKKHHPRQVKVLKSDFLKWKQIEPRPSLIIGMELLDNLAHDRVRWTAAGDLEQAMVVTNENARYFEPQGTFSEIFLPATDPLIIETVNLLDVVGYRWPSLSHSYEKLYDIWPLSLFMFDRPWGSEFIPTMAVNLLRTITKYFPKHHLLFSDFHKLPKAIKGHGAPVVQTHYNGEPVACSTYLLKRGLFDIFFPTDFGVLSKIYLQLLGKREGMCEISEHSAFCGKWMEINKTKTKSGYNPLIETFENASFWYN